MKRRILAVLITLGVLIAMALPFATPVMAGAGNSVNINLSVVETYAYPTSTVHYEVQVTNDANVLDANPATVSLTFSPPGTTGAEGSYGTPITLATNITLAVGETRTYNWNGSGADEANAGLAVNLGTVPLDSNATAAYAYAAFTAHYIPALPTPEYNGSGNKDIPLTILHSGSTVTIGAVSTSIESGHSTTLNVSETNTGLNTLSAVHVVINNGTSDIADLNQLSANFVSSNSTTDSYLEPNEMWSWTLVPTGTLTTTTVFTANGHGLDLLNTDIAAPAFSNERRTVTVNVKAPGTDVGITANPTTVTAIGETVDLTITEANIGDTDLTNVSVEVNDGASTIATLTSADSHSGDTVDPGTLNAGETWTWHINDIVITQLGATTFTAIGDGTYGSPAVHVTIPQFPLEQAEVTVSNIPHTPASSNVGLGILIAGLLGVMVYVGYRRTRKA